MDRRFQSKCSSRNENGCILWCAAIHRFGYGQFFYNGSMRQAHRVAWELANGPIPVGMQVNHRCDVRRCVNPEHLYLGSQRQNVEDMLARGRCRRRGLKGEENVSAKLTADRVIEIRAIGAKEPQWRIAKRYGVSQMIVSKILRGLVWRHV